MSCKLGNHTLHFWGAEKMQAHLAKTYPGILQGRAILSVGRGLQRGNRSSSKANTWPAWPVNYIQVSPVAALREGGDQVLFTVDAPSTVLNKDVLK